MNVEEEILLRKILDELKLQNQYLFDIRKRLEDLDGKVGQNADGAETPIDRKQSR